MRTISFPLGAVDLVLKTPDSLTSTELENLIIKVTEAIQVLNEELNHNYAKSEVTRFNDSDLGFPVSLSHRLANFLDLNLKYYDHSGGAFNPFSAHQIPNWPLSSSDIVEYRPDSRLAFRQQDVKLSSTLLNTFILDNIDEMLRSEFDLHNFFMYTPSLVIARGNLEWEIAFEIDPSINQVPVKLYNQTVVLELSDSIAEALQLQPDLRMFNPFSGDSPKKVTHPAVITSAETLSHAKVVAKQALFMRYPLELQSLANQWHSGISVVLPSGNLQSFTST